MMKPKKVNEIPTQIDKTWPRDRSYETSARVVLRSEDRVSPWVRLVAKGVQFTSKGPVQTYYCLDQPDYVAILARTCSGLYPIVRQYRPAVDDYTWELPAGLVDQGEEPDITCRRELKEETGLDALHMTCLGAFYPDVGRLENLAHVYFVAASDPDPGFVPEPGMAVEFVDSSTLQQLIRARVFKHLLHLGVLSVALFSLEDTGLANVRDSR